MSNLTCGFIGLGLIGGSIAKALKTADPSIKIIAYDVNKETLTFAFADKSIDTAVSCIDEHFTACDYIFLCAPVSYNDGNLSKIKNVLSPNCILTDVGSVKTTIHEHVAAAGLSGQFIGGHPMAGSERIGYRNSKALLLQNAYYILTPEQQVSEEKLSAYQNLVRKMGAIPLVLSYQQHDFVTAGISHLPHLIASSLVNLIKDVDSKDGIMKMVAAGGFKDITRIASSSPIMWQQVCLTNGENISGLLSSYIDILSKVKDSLDNQDEDSLYELFDSARTYRESFLNTSSGPIKQVYDMTVDIDDKPGALAAIATLLAKYNISIKNIGITHNREAAEGAMRIEFNDADAVIQAKELLQKNGYDIKIRTL